MHRPHPVVLAAAAALGALTIGTAQAQGASYAVDPMHTFATFEIDHMGAAVNRGRFDRKEGMVEFDRAGKTGKVDLTLHMSSINTGTPAFDARLKSADIFDVEQFPTARFVGDTFSFDGDKVTEVAGKLTLKGKTQPVVFKARQFNCYQSGATKREVCGGDFEATIDRTAFGVDFGVNFGASKTVRIVAQIEAAKL